MKAAAMESAKNSRFPLRSESPASFAAGSERVRRAGDCLSSAGILPALISWQAGSLRYVSDETLIRLRRAYGGTRAFRYESERAPKKESTLQLVAFFVED
jgi:hypothetical protein